MPPNPTPIPSTAAKSPKVGKKLTISKSYILAFGPWKKWGFKKRKVRISQNQGFLLFLIPLPPLYAASSDDTFDDKIKRPPPIGMSFSSFLFPNPNITIIVDAAVALMTQIGAFSFFWRQEKEGVERLCSLNWSMTLRNRGKNAAFCPDNKVGKIKKNPASSLPKSSRNDFIPL